MPRLGLITDTQECGDEWRGRGAQLPTQVGGK
jgi:hypothetical protein